MGKLSSFKFNLDKLMGIDLEKRGKKKKTIRKNPKTNNLYVRLLARLYGFLTKRTGSKFNSSVLHRLFTSRNNSPPVSIKQIAKTSLRKDAKKKIIVVVGTVTNDNRITHMPTLKICALRFTEGSRNRIIKAGGTCLTFDQLALQSPTGSDTILIRGPLKGRKVYRYFEGKPYIRGKGRKFERGKHHDSVNRNKRS